MTEHSKQFPFAVGSPHDTAIFLRSVSGLPADQQANGKVLAGLADVASIQTLAQGLGFAVQAAMVQTMHCEYVDQVSFDAPAPGAVQVPMVQTVHNRVLTQKQASVQTCAELLEPDPGAPLDGPFDSGKAGVQDINACVEDDNVGVAVPGDKKIAGGGRMTSCAALVAAQVPIVRCQDPEDAHSMTFHEKCMLFDGGALQEGDRAVIGDIPSDDVPANVSATCAAQVPMVQKQPLCSGGAGVTDPLGPSSLPQISEKARCRDPEAFEATDGCSQMSSLGDTQHDGDNGDVAVCSGGAGVSDPLGPSSLPHQGVSSTMDGDAAKALLGGSVVRPSACAGQRDAQQGGPCELSPISVLENDDSTVAKKSGRKNRRRKAHAEQEQVQAPAHEKVHAPLAHAEAGHVHLHEDLDIARQLAQSMGITVQEYFRQWEAAGWISNGDAQAALQLL